MSKCSSSTWHKVPILTPTLPPCMHTYSDTGTTPTPIPEVLKGGETCSQHKDRIRFNWMRITPSAESWHHACNMTRLQEKADAGTLTMPELLFCYWPQCTQSGEYAVTQCMQLQRERWCWCSGPTGLEIDGTLALKEDMPTDACSKYWAASAIPALVKHCVFLYLQYRPT